MNSPIYSALAVLLNTIDATCHIGTEARLFENIYTLYAVEYPTVG